VCLKSDQVAKENGLSSTQRREMMHTVIKMNAKDTFSHVLVPVSELPCAHIFCEAGILRLLNNSSSLAQTCLPRS
jgi:hypothetical protein